MVQGVIGQWESLPAVLQRRLIWGIIGFKPFEKKEK